MPEFHTAVATPDAVTMAQGDATALFPWFSFTKTVIATLAMLLRRDGALDLDRPLDGLNGQPYTTRQLLMHQSGLRDYAGLSEYHADVARGRPPWDRTTFLAKSQAHSPLFAPGQGWAYSNIGYMIAREQVEQAAQMPFAALFQARIAAPLGLERSKFAANPADFSALHWPAVRSYHPDWVAHGTLLGTAPEAAKLMQALVQGQILPLADLDEMKKAHVLGGPLHGRPWQTCGYGTGLMTGSVARPCGGETPAFGHSGLGTVCANAVYHFPATGRSVAVFTSGTSEAPAEFEAARFGCAPA
ncbi:MAG: serine hydrolase domain-containing protein [Paracoccaceae bacterium]